MGKAIVYKTVHMGDKTTKKVEKVISIKAWTMVKFEGGEDIIGIASEVVANFISWPGWW